MSELKSCPRCGCTDIDWGFGTGTLCGMDYAQCEKCGRIIWEVSKPGDYSHTAALESWPGEEEMAETEGLDNGL